MSSSAVYQLLQITVPRADSKPAQTGSSQDGQFQDLLARASSTAKSQPEQAAERNSLRQSDEPSTGDSGHNESPQYDDASTNSKASSDVQNDAATDNHETSKESPSDTVELSEAVELVLPEETVTQPSLEVLVIDAPGVENLAAQTEAESEVAVEQYAKSFEVITSASQFSPLPEEEAEATVPSEIVDAENSSFQEEPNLPASELALKPDESQATDAEGKMFATQTPSESSQLTTPIAVVEQQVQPALEQGPATSTQNGEVGIVDAAVGPEKPIDQETKSKERKQSPGQTSESPLLKADSVEGADELVGAIKENASALSSPSSQAGVHPAADSRASSSPLAENSATSDAHLELDPVPTVDRARFVQRVSRAFQRAQARDGLIQLRLSPPELGSMKISITTQEGVLSAKVEVETAAARNLLLDNLPALRERLAEQEIRIEKFDVDVSRDERQETDSSSAEDRRSRESEEGLSPSRRDSESSDEKTTSSKLNINPIDQVTESGLDVRI